MKIIIFGRHALTCAAISAASVLLASCDDESEDVRKAPPVAASDAAIVRTTWLDLSDETPPEVWLAARETGTPQAPDGAAAAGFRRLLQQAAGRVNETPRVIANRTVQLETMLAEQGIDESARALLTGFLSAEPADAARRDYGALCQHYFNLRSTGVDRSTALAVLAVDRPTLP